MEKVLYYKISLWLFKAGMLMRSEIHILKILNKKEEIPCL